ncbi:hypothetical protein L208DRAFT_1385846 [Tricholoma matsutake]|nr:hypothetical protein L208DRAFT_1385846 [Tricholoma matsutake 945]
MPAYNRNRNALAIPDDGIVPAVDKVNLSPATPAVTGIVYPSSSPMDAPTETESTRYRPPPHRLYSHPNIAASSIDDVPESLVDGQALDQLWGSIRQQKERKMAKERPKVQSLEEAVNEVPSENPAVDIPVLESQASGRKSLQKQKSISSFRESTDGRSIVASFDMQDVPKQNIHVSFQRTRLVITWEIAELYEWEEGGYIMRERLERMFNRTLPLPEGTRFEEIRAQMNGHHLVLRYPNMRCLKVDVRSRSGES